MTRKILTHIAEANEEGIASAAEFLEAEGVVALPTETVYGLAARADSDLAVAKIYAAKGRPSFNPLIIHVSNLEMALAYGDFSAAALKVAEAAWPGALTLVVPLKAGAKLAASITAGLPTIAIRMPSHAIMREIITRLGVALAAPSANMSNFVSPTTAAHVLSTLDGRIDMILDGGATDKGLESTILAIREDGTWHELRPGPVDVAELALKCGHSGPVILAKGAAENIEAPGQMATHYSPGKPLRLNASEAEADEFFISFGLKELGDFSLSETGDVEEAASRLYHALHEAARSEKPRIAIAPVPEAGVGAAINDRLRRAAT